MPGKYLTGQAFRQALDARLRQQSISEGIELRRLQRRVVFERFLARLFTGGNTPWILKGGYSLELRLHEMARATIDLDLSVPIPNDLIPKNGNHFAIIREFLQDAIAQDLDDSFTFFVSASEVALQGPVYGGIRFSIEARQNNRTFASFHVDVALGDTLLSEPELITGHDLLSFAEIPPVQVAALPLQQHFAEKIHAYTLPRSGELNTRIKDLIDLVLLIDMGLPENDLVAEAVRSTFARRKTHDIPGALPAPPDMWRERYGAIATECGVSRRSIESAIEYVSNYWDALNIEG